LRQGITHKITINIQGIKPIKRNYENKRNKKYKKQHKMVKKHYDTEEKNINFNEKEVCILKRALNCLVLEEQDTINYTDLFDKLESYYL